MAISDDDLVRQLESVPQVQPPDMREAVMGRLKTPLPLGEGGAKRRVRVLAGLAWAAAIVIVVAVAVERKNLPWQQTSATMAPVPVEQWPIVARIAVPDEGRLTVRRNGNQFAIQPFAAAGSPVSVAWDQKKLQMSDVLPDTKGPEVIILQRRPGAVGTAVIQLNVAGHEVLKTAISVE